MTAARREHAGRVAGLLGDWASELELADSDRELWIAAGWLHDALRDAPAEELRRELGPAFDAWPGSALHGPAAAERLAGEAPPLRQAIRHHTLGGPGLEPLGRALYAADYLEPGRSFAPELRARLRERMPHELDAVTREVVRARVEHLRKAGKVPHPLTEDFLRSLEAT